MSNAVLRPSLLLKINENQQALEAAILELTNWIEQRGSGEVGVNVRGALTAIDRLLPVVRGRKRPKAVVRKWRLPTRSGRSHRKLLRPKAADK